MVLVARLSYCQSRGANTAEDFVLFSGCNDVFVGAGMLAIIAACAFDYAGSSYFGGFTFFCGTIQHDLLGKDGSGVTGINVSSS